MLYHEAESLFRKARNKDRGARLRGREGRTRLVKTERGYGIQYCATVIIEILQSGEYILNSGGYRTRSTKAKINEFSPARLHQTAHVWYVHTESGEPVPFQDGIKIDAEGKPVNAKASDGIKIVKAQASKVAKVKAYVKAFIAKIEAGELPKPSAGDCMGCAMRTTTGEVLGDVAMKDHVHSHLDEGCHVPSLLVNALRESGYRPEYVNPWNGLGSGRDTTVYKRALTQYLLKRGV